MIVRALLISFSPISLGLIPEVPEYPGVTPGIPQDTWGIQNREWYLSMRFGHKT